MELSEVGAFPSLAEAPPRADDVAGDERASVAGGDHEGQGAAQLDAHGPERAPVAVHGDPARGRALDLHGPHVAGAAHVVDEHHEEPWVASHREPNPAALRTPNPVESTTTLQLVVGARSACN